MECAFGAIAIEMFKSRQIS